MAQSILSVAKTITSRSNTISTALLYTKEAAIHVGSLYVGSCHAVLNFVSRF